MNQLIELRGVGAKDNSGSDVGVDHHVLFKRHGFKVQRRALGYLAEIGIGKLHLSVAGV